MPEFLDFLSMYFTCEAMASLRPPSRAEAMGCADMFDTVKRHFLDGAPMPFGSPERAEQMRRAYMNFLSWQNANAVLVADLRAAAEARALSLLPFAVN